VLPCLTEVSCVNLCDEKEREKSWCSPFVSILHHPSKNFGQENIKIISWNLIVSAHTYLKEKHTGPAGRSFFSEFSAKKGSRLFVWLFFLIM